MSNCKDISIKSKQKLSVWKNKIYHESYSTDYVILGNVIANNLKFLTLINFAIFIEREKSFKMLREKKLTAIQTEISNTDRILYETSK